MGTDQYIAPEAYDSRQWEPGVDLQFQEAESFTWIISLFKKMTQIASKNRDGSAFELKCSFMSFQSCFCLSQKTTVSLSPKNKSGAKEGIFTTASDLFAVGVTA